MRLSYRANENTLRLTLDQERGHAERTVDLSGYVDMGTGGRIAGVEALGGLELDLERAFDRWLSDDSAAAYVSLGSSSVYIELSAPEESDVREQIRAIEATFTAEIDAEGRMVALSIPRRGAGYEISYPSGNR